MKQTFKNQEELAKYADKVFEEIMIKRFHYKGDWDNEKKIKEFMRLKKIHIVCEANEKKGIDKLIFEHHYKPKYTLIIDYQNLTVEEV